MGDKSSQRKIWIQKCLHGFVIAGPLHSPIIMICSLLGPKSQWSHVVLVRVTDNENKVKARWIDLE